MKIKLTVTAKGAALKQNKWIEGQEIEVHNLTGAIFVAKGFCTEVGESNTINAEPFYEKKVDVIEAAISQVESSGNVPTCAEIPAELAKPKKEVKPKKDKK